MSMVCLCIDTEGAWQSLGLSVPSAEPGLGHPAPTSAEPGLALA